MLGNKLIDDNYQIIKKIGSGGSSEVYLAKHNRLDMLCAIKVMEKKKNQFIDGKKEAFLLRDLNHPKIPRIIDVLEDYENIYIVMEYCEGSNLREKIDRYGAMEYEKISYIANQIADALSFLHKKEPAIIYRDLKPSNIIINDDYDVMLIDMGICRNYDVNKEDDTRYIGSRKYAAPEQFGIHQTSIQTDIYSFGLLLYYLYTAEDYIDIEDSKKWRKFSGVKATKLKNAIIKSISLESQDRHKNIDEFIKDAFISNKVYPETAMLNKDSFAIAHSYQNKKEAAFYTKINIGIMGLNSGVGASHIAISMARVLAEMNYKVKVFDVSNKGQLSNLYAFNKGYLAFEKSKVKSFKYHGFEVISEENPSFTKLLSQDYEIGIFDFGSHHRLSNELLRMQSKIIILPSSPFAIHDGAGFLKELKNYKDIEYLINLKQDNIKDLIDYLDLDESKTNAIGFIDNNKSTEEYREVFLKLSKIKKGNKTKSILKKLFA